MWLLNKGIGLEKLKGLERANGDDTGEAYLGIAVVCLFGRQLISISGEALQLVLWWMMRALNLVGKYGTGSTGGRTEKKSGVLGVEAVCLSVYMCSSREHLRKLVVPCCGYWRHGGLIRPSDRL